MRELKGDWKDLFNGFMLALDPRKMFLGFAALLFSLVPLAGTAMWAEKLDPDFVQKPGSLAPSELCRTFGQSFHVIYSGTDKAPADWKVQGLHGAGFVILMLAIWSFFGGAIARIAAYEIAKDGERLEINRALGFARRKFWSFFMAPWICVLGLLFFAGLNWGGGFIGRLLDFMAVGGPVVALLLPLALLSGFFMTLILIGTAAGAPLFAPAVAAEGTDAFDAVSRGFSYIYSRPWHYAWYQGVTALYGSVACAFVLVFAILFCHIGLSTGASGFDTFFSPKADAAVKDSGHAKFRHVTDAAWSLLLDKDYQNNPCAAKAAPAGHAATHACGAGCCASWCPYPWAMYAGHQITGLRDSRRISIDEIPSGGHRIAAYIVLTFLVLSLGMAYGYVPSYLVSQQTMIYYLMRKKVDGIEMNEVFEEAEEEEKPAAPPAPPADAKPPVKA